MSGEPVARADGPQPPHEPGFTGCFGCGQGVAIGLRMTPVTGEPGRISLDLRVDREHQGAAGVAHGGVLAAALDEAVGQAAWSLGRRMVVARLEVDFRRPVPVGARLRVQAWCTAEHKRKVYVTAQARLCDPTGGVVLAEVVAQAEAVCVEPAAPLAASHTDVDSADRPC